MSEDKRYYRQRLPHFTPNDSPYFGTFRLANSLPGDLLRRTRLQSEAGIIPFHEYDRLLDRGGNGEHWLKDSRLANIVVQALHHFADDRYRLWAFTVMSNHVHVVLTLNEGESLWRVLHSIKSFTAHECNAVLRRRGAFWQHESYDHVVREYEFGKIIFYVLRNPVKAGLVSSIRAWPYSYVNSSLDGFDDTEYMQMGAFRE
jgi:putative transposase